MSTQPAPITFLTAYDPSELPGGSLDPLGFETGYLRLADEILPGFTTITDTPRYLAMLCAGIYIATVGNEETIEDRFAEGKMLEQVLRFERLWALACVLQLRASPVTQVSFTIRGVSFVKEEADRIIQQKITTINPDKLKFLKHQRSAGGLGAYKTMLERFGLLIENEWRLSSDSGMSLAQAFLEPTRERAGRLITVVRNGGEISVARLRAWGEVCNPFTRLPEKERRIITDCLRENPRRDIIQRAIKTVHKDASAINDGWDEIATLKRLHKEILSLPERPQELVPKNAIEAALRVTVPYEETYQAMDLLFERLLWLTKRLGTSISLKTAASDSVVQLAQSELLLHVTRLKTALNKSEILSPEAAEATQELLKLFPEEGDREQVKSYIPLILERHRSVQSRKHDMGRPKGPWLIIDGERLVLTASAEGLDYEASSPSDIRPHSYRVTNLLRFKAALGL